MNYQTKLDIEFENSNQWREIKFLWVDPFQNLTIPINLPLANHSAQGAGRVVDLPKKYTDINSCVF